MKQIKKRNTYIIIVILILQLLLSLFIANKKDFLFFDEFFSYASANNIAIDETELPENEWLDKNWYLEYIGVTEMHKFEYAIPYRNQVEDVHPPLFYFFLHTACSMVPGHFSYLAGVGFNIIFFLCSTVVLFSISKELFANDICALLTSFLYAVSYGGLNTMVFVRMYMLLTLMTLLHIYVYLKFFEKDEVTIKGCLLLMLTLLGGVLTQYYFLFIALWLGIWYTVRYVLKKQYKNLIKYLVTVFASAGISLLIWPSMISHLFLGGRGQEAQSNLLSLDGYVPALKEMFRILSNEMFTNLLPVILICLGILLMVSIIKKNSVDVVLWKKAAVIVFTCVGYYVVVSKAAPYLVERYMMPIYPLVYLLVVGASYMLFTKFIPAKFAGALCVIGFAGLSVVHIVSSGIPYTFEKNQNNVERHKIVEQYQDNYALYISDNKGAHFFDAVQMLKEYKGYYYVYNLENTEKVKADMDVLRDEAHVMVYVKDKRTIEEADAFISTVFPGCTLNDASLVDIDEKWSVYLLEIDSLFENGVEE